MLRSYLTIATILVIISFMKLKNMVIPLGLPWACEMMALVTPSVHFIRSMRRMHCAGKENSHFFRSKGF